MITQQIQYNEDPILFQKMIKNYKTDSKDIQVIQKKKKSNEVNIQKKYENSIINGTYKFPIQKKISNISISQSIKSLEQTKIYNINLQNTSKKQQLSPKKKNILTDKSPERMINNQNSRKILGLKKIKQLNKSNSKSNQKFKIPKISLCRNPRQINLYQTGLKQHKQEFSNNIMNHQQQKHQKSYHSIESKSLEKKNNIERSIEKLKISCLKDSNFVNHSNTQHKNKSMKRQIKSVSAISKKLQLTNSRTQTITNSQQFCAVQKRNSINKQNCCFPSQEKKSLQEKRFEKGNKKLFVQKRQIRIITSKKFKKSTREQNQRSQNDSRKKIENVITRNQISPFYVRLL